MSEGGPFLLGDLDKRSRDVFRTIVDTFLETGEPVGSRTLSRALPMALSPATIRNVMADLEQMGLLFAPHVSAGRLPTELGLRMFVDGLLEIGALSEVEREQIEAQVAGSGRNAEDVLREATQLLSGLSQCAGLVMVAKGNETRLKHIEFVSIGPDTALVVMVTEDGAVENRVIDMPAGLPPSVLSEATNFLNARLRGRSLKTAQAEILRDISEKQQELDALTAKVIKAGLAKWAGGDEGDKTKRSLIVRGQSKLLEDLNAVEDLERIRMLFDDLERGQEVVELLGLAEEGEGVKIFIGSENKLFSLSGSSIVASPYVDRRQNVVGVIGVIGPTRLNYARVIPMVDYTAKIVGKLLS